MSLSLTIRDLRVTAGDAPLLQLEALEVPAGSLLGIRGPSGAGKTTFLHAIAGLRERASGQVTWDGTDLLALTAEGRTRFRARNMGMIFQDFLLFDELGAGANAALGAMFRPRGERAALRARAAGLLRHLGLPDSTRPVASFSGGERQRVGIARALASDAPVVLADEPTAALHRAAAEALTGDLVRLVREGRRSLIAVSHDEALLAQMDRVLTIEAGRITDDSRGVGT
ncbi:ATP-binding cassette domain-containing protein [Oceanicola sp. S124]|uniref:ATP-binding cassette domain-containing protein n=1 Tax=Oceanicola sp. S124 TaxID=1042378 RepID=UPI0002558228|nr:ATP-binding cassette domain-containing protein [Oceanicola sp. S124]